MTDRKFLSLRWESGQSAAPVRVGAKIAAALQVGERGQRPDLDPVVLSIEAKVRRAGKGKRFVIGNDAETEVNAGLVELIKEAFAIRNQLLCRPSS